MPTPLTSPVGRSLRFFLSRRTPAQRPTEACPDPRSSLDKSVSEPPPALRSQWNLEDPNDPDLELVFHVLPGDVLKIRVWPPLALAQRLLGKPPVITLRPDATGRGWEVRLVLGLTALYRRVGHRLDSHLPFLVQLEKAVPLGGTTCTPVLVAYTPLHLCFPPLPSAGDRL